METLALFLPACRFFLLFFLVIVVVVEPDAVLGRPAAAPLLSESAAMPSAIAIASSDVRAGGDAGEPAVPVGIASIRGTST